MILTDKDIKKRIETGSISIKDTIKWFDTSQIGPASVDFRLWNNFKFYDKSNVWFIDPKQTNSSDVMKSINIKDQDSITIHPQQFILGTTKEYLEVPSDLVVRCEWRSSLGRLWLIIHSTAWFVDPGFSWYITLEMTNINEVPIILYPWMRVWQFAFHLLTSECETPYNQRKSSKYMHQEDVKESKVYEDF